jgi:acyl carrier protein phosphodiesterase
LNYLAHIYLSGKEEEVKIGGFIADSIKGSKYNEYPEGMRFGILLHRKIDTYTDTHPAVMKSIQRFRHVYGRYSGVAVDMLYDHYLASDWKNYSDLDLKEFAGNFYTSLNKYKTFLPERFLQFMPIFIRKDRLSSYANLTAFEEVLQKMGEHTAMPAASDAAIDLIWSEYYNFKDDFLNFFPDLAAYTQKLFRYRNAEPKEVLAYKPT